MEYVRNGPPGLVLALLRYMPPAIGLIVVARGVLSRSAKQFASDCAETGSISPERFGCCPGEDQARGLIANFTYINRAFGRVLLRGVARSGSGPARGSHSCYVLWARSNSLLATRARRECGGPRTRGTRLATGLRPGSPPQRERWGGAIPGWQLT